MMFNLLLLFGSNKSNGFNSSLLFVLLNLSVFLFIQFWRLSNSRKNNKKKLAKKNNKQQEVEKMLLNDDVAFWLGFSWYVLGIYDVVLAQNNSLGDLRLLKCVQ